MQVFLPYSEFDVSIKILDDRRLGKQRVEARTLIECLVQEDNRAWSNHPACRMFKGYLAALSHYYNLCLEEWEARGFKNTICQPFEHKRVKYPPWLGYPKFHSIMRANLVRKDPEYYGQFMDEQPQDGYFWPVRLDYSLEPEITEWKSNKKVLNVSN